MARKSSSRLASAGILIVAVLLAAFPWQSVRDEVAMLADEVQSQENELATLQAEVASLISLEAELPVAETERARILEAVPIGLRQDQLVTDLTDIADAVDISLNSINFSLQNSDLVTSNVISMSANFTGGYEDLIELLQAIESNERVFKVTSVGVQLGDLTEDGYEMTFNVSIEAYYQD